MESLFDFEDYRAYLAAKIRTFPKKGHGAVGRLASYIEVHPSLVSQILNGQKQLSADQAFATAEFLELSDIETEYFLLLTQLDRAGTKKLKKFLTVKITKIRDDSKRLSTRLSSEKILSEAAQGTFYSDWIYSAVRQLTAIKNYSRPPEIAQALGISLKEARSILDFLQAHGLCKESDGSYAIGPQSTFLPATSPWVRLHHRNWRERAQAAIRLSDDDDLFYSCPMTVSQVDAVKIRELLIQMIEQTNKIVDPSPSEELVCLNIDWFKIVRAAAR